MPPRELILLYRAVGYMNWLAGADWAHWEVDLALPSATATRLRSWRRKLLAWLDDSRTSSKTSTED